MSKFVSGTRFTAGRQQSGEASTAPPAFTERTDNMSNNVTDTISTCWEKLSLHERRSFLAFNSSQLLIDFCDARDAKGLELFHQNLTAITEFADTMRTELEHRERKDSLQKSFTALHEEIEKGGFTQQVAQHLEALSEDVKQFLLEDPEDEYYENGDEDAYNNIVAAMKAEEAKVADMLPA